MELIITDMYLCNYNIKGNAMATFQTSIPNLTTKSS